AAVHYHAHRAGQPVARYDPLAVAAEHRTVAGLAPGPAAPALGHDDLPQLEDLVAVERVAAEHQLEAVELGRVVRPGDLDPAVRAERGDPEIERRCGQHADIDRG